MGEENSLAVANMELKSSKPDLEVVVGTGENQHVFQCYAVILSSYSEYVDTMLSLPMREQSERKITFPEITPQIWVKLMEILKPGSVFELTLELAQELLPFCHQYEFRPALGMFERFLLPMLTRFMETDVEQSEYDPSVATAASLLFDVDLSLSKPKTIECANRMFQLHARELTEDDVRSLVPAVQESDAALKFFWHHMYDKPLNVDLDEVQALTEEEVFPAKFVSRGREIAHQLDFFCQLNLGSIEVVAGGADIPTGEYTLLDSRYAESIESSEFMMSLGIMAYEYSFEVERSGPSVWFIVQSMDPFGHRWVWIREEEGSEDYDELFFWESENGSLLPPRSGWSVGKHGSGPVPKLKYHFG